MSDSTAAVCDPANISHGPRGTEHPMPSGRIATIEDVCSPLLASASAQHARPTRGGRPVSGGAAHGIDDVPAGRCGGPAAAAR
ncbi:hypothetical protein [Nocardia sp. N2S4-5]|uniref:hypothetical protein n=1 Tax=Nocardia sp. N2S4-5 TaxID=3351565 RepID=UPI0037D5DFDD